MKMANKALWSGRFEKEMDEDVLAFTSSMDVDSRLAFYDVMGSIAHVKMLGERGILPQDDVTLITDGLKTILQEILDERMELEKSVEDIHTNIETRLTEIIGQSGGKLHTGRSRNDQVATDFRMYLRDRVLEIVKNVNDLQRALMAIAEREKNSIMPGYTHMQHAQPVSLGFHMMAHTFRLDRDGDRFMEAFKRINMCPLGSAALAGTTYPIDRRLTSDMLGFNSPTPNAMDSVSDRDFVLDVIYCCSTVALHLSSLCEELIIWSSPEFGFVEMDDTYSTGSSIMPQKKNPDIAELVRGRTGRVTGSLIQLMTIVKSLPMAYNRDLQEDKEPAMRAVETVLSCLIMSERMVSTLKFNTDRMRAMTEIGFINATDLADYLVMKGAPFRKAHEVVAGMVKACIESKRNLTDMTLEEMRSYSELIEEDVFEAIDLDNCVRRRCSYGGTSPRCVEIQITECIDTVIRRESLIEDAKKKIESSWERLLA